MSSSLSDRSLNGGLLGPVPQMGPTDNNAASLHPGSSVPRPHRFCPDNLDPGHVQAYECFGEWTSEPSPTTHPSWARYIHSSSLSPLILKKDEYGTFEGGK